MLKSGKRQEVHVNGKAILLSNGNSENKERPRTGLSRLTRLFPDKQKNKEKVKSPVLNKEKTGFNMSSSSDRFSYYDKVFSPAV